MASELSGQNQLLEMKIKDLRRLVKNDIPQPRWFNDSCMEENPEIYESQITAFHMVPSVSIPPKQ